MSTKTHTTTTHYHIQKKRRAEFIDEWHDRAVGFGAGDEFVDRVETAQP